LKKPANTTTVTVVIRGAYCSYCDSGDKGSLPVIWNVIV